MIRPDHIWKGIILGCLCILTELNTVVDGHHNERCTTWDGMRGVCVVKRLCREASRHLLAPCERHSEYLCCPFPTSQRSATVQPNRPREDDRARPDQDNSNPRPNVHKDPKSDDKLNTTTTPGDRRIEVPHKKPENSRGNEKRDQPTRRPDTSRFTPAKEEPHPVRYPKEPRRPKPSPRPQERTTTKAPIEFPETLDRPVPRPTVPVCGVKPYDFFIAGGKQSGEHEWPWMTAICQRSSSWGSKTCVCGGSLISTKYVLSAAHCFIHNDKSLPASLFVVRLGSHDMTRGEEYTVSNLVIHPNHANSGFFNDIALVQLASEVSVTDKIAPICLPFPETIQDNLVGRKATVAGWGDTSFRTSPILQDVTIPVVSGEECSAAYSRIRAVSFLARGSDHIICAGLREGGKDACPGDSGGPLMLKTMDDRWMVVGIVSFGYKCAEPGFPGIYTRVTHYMSWIKRNMKQQ